MCPFFHFSRVPWSVLDHLADVGVPQLLLVECQPLQPQGVLEHLQWRTHATEVEVQRELVEVLQHDCLPAFTDASVVGTHEVRQISQTDTRP